MVRRTQWVLNLAFSHSNVHEWLLPSTGGEAFRSLCGKAGVSRVAFLRHGRTAPKPENGIDFDRLLTEEGRDQAREAGSSFGSELKPYYSQMLVSPAPRTMETAKLLLGAANVPPTSCNIKPVQSLYDGTMQPKGSQLFQKLGYAPLRDYVDSSDAKDREVSRSLLGAYATTVIDTMVDTMQSSAAASATSVDDGTLWMVGHAIYLPAAALGVASIVECDEAGIETILSRNIKESEGFLIDIRQSKVSYLSRPSSQTQ